MIRIDTRRRLVLRTLQAWDLALFAGCFLVIFARDTGGIRGHITPSILHFTVWLGLSCVVLHFALIATRLYRSQRLVRSSQVPRIVCGVMLGVAGSAAIAAVLTVPLTPSEFTKAALSTIVAVLCTRMMVYRLLHALRLRGRNLRYALVIGRGERATALVKRLQERSTGYRIIGYIDGVEDPAWAAALGLRYLGTLEALPAIIAHQILDDVFVTLPLRSCYDNILRVILDCENQGVPVRLPLDFFRSSISTSYVDQVGGAFIVSFMPSPVSPVYVIVKRLVDMVAAALGLLLLLPLLVVVALWIKIDSPGSVFFIQPRVGLNKRLFSLIKFRTMYGGSERRMRELESRNEASGPVFKMKDDPRITGAGRILRRTSIDELPQLINVLLGHMSLVGPRPLPSRDVAGFTVDWQRRRFSVKPGITCLWQISGRSSLSFEQWMKLDMLYIDQRSLGLDLQILMRTLPAVLAQRGAY